MTFRAFLLVLATAEIADPTRAANPAEIFELPRVEVIGTTPLPGLGTALSDVPANVQVFGNRDFSRQRSLDLTGFLDRNANSVGVGSGQGNPYQQDLNFRGFAASRRCWEHRRASPCSRTACASTKPLATWSTGICCRAPPSPPSS
jgi:hypothetical protein